MLLGIIERELAGEAPVVMAVVADSNLEWTHRYKVDAVDGSLANVDERESLEACPGCGCLPGDGRTLGCVHPDGCGFNG